MKIQIFGKQDIDQDLDPDKEISVAFMRMGIRKTEIDNSTDEKIFKLDSLGEIIIKQGEEYIRAKSKDKTAQKIRNRFWLIHNDLGLVEDFETWYDRKKGELIVKLDEIYDKFLRD